MGYLVLGLAATGVASAGLNAAPVRTSRTGRFSPAAGDTRPAPTPDTLRNHDRSEVQRKLDRFVANFNPIPVDSRPQSALPTVNESRECLPFTAQMLSSIVRWRQGADLQAQADAPMTQDFSLKFGVKEQARMLDALIDKSPTLQQALQEAKRKKIRIAWNDYSSWLPESKAIHLSRQLKLKPKDVIANPQAVFASVLYLFGDLSHELCHSTRREINATPSAHHTFADFEEAHLGHIARSEALAVFGELNIAQELFEATGVIVPVATANYRCGTPQSIFHSNDLSTDEKIDSLADFLRLKHPAFQSTYKEEAIALWAAAVSGKGRRRGAGGSDEL